MSFESHFQRRAEIEFEVEGGNFLYRPVTAGEENDWLSEYMELNPETGRYVQNFTRLNKCKIRNLVKVPYTKDDIKNILNIECEWANLNSNQRWLLLSKLKPSIFDSILTEINKIDKGGIEAENQKKNS